MLKKLFFSVFFFFLSGSFSLWAQEPEQDPIPPFFHPSVPETIFIPLNQNIPAEVQKTKNESMVAVRVTIPNWRYDYRIYKNYFFGGGVTVWSDYVATSLHLASEYPALWLGNKDFPTVFQISDGKAVFNTSLAYYDYQADLALLKVDSPNWWGAVFQQKPARLAKYTTVQDSTLFSPKVLFEKFYAFGYYTSDPHLFFAVELGPFRSITNSFDGNYLLDIPMGMLQGKVQKGFSGGPLLSPEGTVMGVVASESALYTYVVLAETLDKFLMSARDKLGLDAEGKPIVAPEEPETK